MRASTAWVGREAWAWPNETVEMPAPARQWSDCSVHSMLSQICKMKGGTCGDFLATFHDETSVFFPKFPVSFARRLAASMVRCWEMLEKSGAGDGNRTHDIQLGKLTYVIDFIGPRSPTQADSRALSMNPAIAVERCACRPGCGIL
jgi:hypothetical protein